MGAQNLIRQFNRKPNTTNKSKNLGKATRYVTASNNAWRMNKKANEPNKPLGKATRYSSVENNLWRLNKKTRKHRRRV